MENYKKTKRKILELLEFFLIPDTIWVGTDLVLRFKKNYLITQTIFTLDRSFYKKQQIVQGFLR